MKKKILAFWLAALLCLTACHRTEEEQREPVPDPGPDQQEEQGLSVESVSESGQQAGEDGSPLLTWSVVLPQVLYNGQPMNNIGNYYDSQMERQTLHVQEELLPLAQERQQAAQTDGKLFTTYTLETDFQVMRQQGDYLSVLRQTVEFTGGVHESTGLAGENWLFREGDCYLLTLQDVLPGAADPRSLVLEQAIAQADARWEEQPDLYFENYRQMMADRWQESDFYLTEDSLVLFFQEYAIGPYTSGPQTFSIPLDALGDALAEGLQP